MCFTCRCFYRFLGALRLVDSSILLNCITCIWILVYVIFWDSVDCFSSILLTVKYGRIHYWRTWGDQLCFIIVMSATVPVMVLTVISLQYVGNPFPPFSCWRRFLTVHAGISKSKWCHKEPTLCTFQICTGLSSSESWWSSPAWSNWILLVDPHWTIISSHIQLCKKSWSWGGDH